jgi:hypothetical protein
MLHEDDDNDENEDQVFENSAFPQARLDAMAQFSKEFDWRKPEPWLAKARWDWTGHFDSAAQAIWIARQVEMLREGLYEIRYPELKSERMIPKEFNIPPGVVDYTARSIDSAGEPEVSRDQPDEIPSVELSTTSTTVSMFNLVLAYQYSDQDIDTAMFAGVPLQPMKAKAVRDQMARALDKIAFLGHVKVPGVKGLLNQSGTTTYTPTATGQGGSKHFDLKSSDDILTDLNALGDQIITDTSEVEEPDTWVLPLTTYRVINRRRVGDGTNQTILKYFVENRDSPITVERTQKLESNMGWTGKRMVAYRKDPSKLQLLVPTLFRQKAPEVRGFKVRVVCQMRTGGVVLWLPKSVAYGDDV